MKLSKSSLLTGIFLLTLGLAWTPLLAKDSKSTDRVTAESGKTMVFVDGKTVPLTEELNLTDSIKVSTNASFTVNNGKARTLPDGAILAKNGMLTTTDGKITPVIDHLIKNGPQVYLFKDGVSTPLKQDYVLPNGIRVSPNGNMYTAKGEFRRFIDGQMLELTGAVIESKDSVTLRDGKVYVQKEGTQYEVAPSRTFMMNDGSKVFGNGTVMKKDGTVVTLTEGQILTLPGVTFGQR